MDVDYRNELSRLARNAERRADAAERARLALERAMREAAIEAGLSVEQIGQLTGVTSGRIWQVVHGEQRTARRPLALDTLCRVLEADGWRHVRGARHVIYEHPEKPGRIALNTRASAISPSTLAVVLDEAGISPDSFERLLPDDGRS
jgi:predicted RNA binding protein YcfA (HicA-like mRNA interferase family)